MALMICPECGKEFSDFAKACPNCAYPVDEKVRRVAIARRNWDTYKENIFRVDLNRRIQYIMKVVAQDMGLFVPRNDEEECLVASFWRGCLDGLEEYTYNTPELLVKLLEQGVPASQQVLAQQIHCPNCGSMRVGKISGFSRGVSIGLFGVGSSKVGKTYECGRCGYKW